MQGPNQMSAGQAKALGARAINAIPTSLTMEQADWLIRQPTLLNDAIQSAVTTLLDPAIATTSNSYEQRFIEAQKRIAVSVGYIAGIDKGEIPVGGIKGDFMKASRLSQILRFAYDYAMGRAEFKRKQFRIDLTPFGFNPYGRHDELIPVSFTELTLVPWGSFIPAEVKVSDDHWDWKITEDYAGSSKACGQATAEWMMEYYSEIPVEWKKALNDHSPRFFCFPGNGWRNEDGKAYLWCLHPDETYSFDRFWLDDDAPTPRHDALVVCRL